MMRSIFNIYIFFNDWVLYFHKGYLSRAMEDSKDVHSLFKKGVRPNTSILYVNSDGVSNEILWLDTEFTIQDELSIEICF